ncbi:DUF1203 domain-containing protein [Microlunatus sp. Gsoil 973]|uniref:DUF1203 domain-containing protein n=1 Tax=Microlunatus sp. Gsoil 973 TaxID=2672569 RepID=UPI0012B4F4E3|nr:DUF1203 domain-containing protein [Microlunatus sp. Gsoil 973]QGN34727.1 DUF1203 domain-containing protein [Microlunatus sp. Gsoil 973]
MTTSSSTAPTDASPAQGRTAQPVPSRRPRAIPEEHLAQLRSRDDAGNAMRPFVATPDGLPIDSVGSPLRCCLRSIRGGERVALVSYAPLRRWAARTGADPGAYDEVGPIFIHADPCPGPSDTSYPFARPGALRTIRRYDSRGHIVGGQQFRIPEDAQDGFARVLDHAFGDPRVVLVHVRALEYGCFQFEVRR